jgi:hypothetical protein
MEWRDAFGCFPKHVIIGTSIKKNILDYGGSNISQKSYF